MAELKKELLEQIEGNTDKIVEMGLHETRLNKIDTTLEQFEKEIIRMRKEGNIDFDRLCSKEEYE